MLSDAAKDADIRVVPYDSATLRCPNCGAPASPDAGRCAYCRSRLAAIGCPVCMALLFDGAAFCPSCGTARSRSEDAQSHATPCPACRGDMHWIRIGDVDLLECASCDGTWIESAAFNRLCTQREELAAVASQGPAAAASAGPAKAGHYRSSDVVSGFSRTADRITYRPCPQCAKLMNRQNFARLSGAIVDSCSSHGTFLDRGELHQIVRFILDGGLDRMRRAELERIKEEQRKLMELELHLSRRRTTYD
jgi:Zn-finger nucleic acid-binding protein